MSLKELKFVVHVKLYKYFTKIFAFQIKPVLGDKYMEYGIFIPRF
jgi:hypothetical protein